MRLAPLTSRRDSLARCGSIEESRRPDGTVHRARGPQGLYPIVRLLPTMSLSDPPTTITVRTSTRRLLEAMKGPRETYDELIEELAEEYYPEAVLKELRRRAEDLRSGRVRTLPASEAYQRLGV